MYEVKMFFNGEDRMNRNKCKEAFCILYKDVCVKGNECFISSMTNYSLCDLDSLDKNEQEFILKEYNNKINKNKSPYLKSIMDIINNQYRESSEFELEKLRAANKILKIKLAYAEEIIAKCMKG